MRRAKKREQTREETKTEIQTEKPQEDQEPTIYRKIKNKTKDLQRPSAPPPPKKIEYVNKEE